MRTGLACWPDPARAVCRMSAPAGFWRNYTAPWPRWCSSWTRCAIVCWNCPGLWRSSCSGWVPRTLAGGLTADAWAALQAHHWPGNLRELAAILAQALERSGGKTIDVGHLPVYLRLEPTPITEDERVLVA